MTSVTIHAAKTHLSRLLARVAHGEEVVIRRGAQPVAKLVPIEHVQAKREFGVLRGQVAVDESFFEQLPEEELEAWGQ